MDENILKLLGRQDYVPANVPELLLRLNLRPNDQQELQDVLLDLEKAGASPASRAIAISSRSEADLIPGASA